MQLALSGKMRSCPILKKGAGVDADNDGSHLGGILKKKRGTYRRRPRQQQGGGVQHTGGGALLPAVETATIVKKREKAAEEEAQHDEGKRQKVGEQWGDVGVSVFSNEEAGLQGQSSEAQRS